MAHSWSAPNQSKKTSKQLAPGCRAGQSGSVCGHDFHSPPRQKVRRQNRPLYALVYELRYMFRGPVATGRDEYCYASQIGSTYAHAHTQAHEAMHKLDVPKNIGLGFMPPSLRMYVPITHVAQTSLNSGLVSNLIKSAVKRVRLRPAQMQQQGSECAAAEACDNPCRQWSRPLPQIPAHTSAQQNTCTCCQSQACGSRETRRQPLNQSAEMILA